MKDSFLERQKRLINYRPKKHVYEFMTRITKLDPNTFSTQERQQIEDELKMFAHHNHLNVVNDLIDLELLAYTGLRETNETTSIPDSVGDYISSIFISDIDQISEVRKIYYTNNFGREDISYAEIETMVTKNNDKVIEEHMKAENSLNYDFINQDSKINFIVREYAYNKKQNYKKIHKVLKNNFLDDSVYNYTAEEISTLRLHSDLRQKELNEMRDMYFSLAHDDSFMTTLNMMYDIRHQNLANSERIKRNDSAFVHSSELLDLSLLRFESTAKELLKYIELDRVHFDSFIRLVDSFSASQSLLRSVY